MYLNEGAANPGSFPAKADLSTSDAQSWVIALGDLDGDGDIDVYSAYDQARYIYLNDGTGNTFTAQNIYGNNAGDSLAGAFMYTDSSAPASESVSLFSLGFLTLSPSFSFIASILFSF